MEKCMICGSDKRLARREGVVLCRRCLAVIYTVLVAKNGQNVQECGEKPGAR